jgi:hypothetical protein
MGDELDDIYSLVLNPAYVTNLMIPPGGEGIEYTTT